MQIIDFKNLIKVLPFKMQSFDIKKGNWICSNQMDTIKWLFYDRDIITINRQDVFNSTSDIKNFIIKTLMWGYPTKGRGKNIDNILEDSNFNKLIEILELYKNNKISSNQFNEDAEKISGLGISTMTKFAYFLNTTINGNRSLILDQQIMEIINLERFEELNHLRIMTYENSFRKYEEYLYTMNDLANYMDVAPDQIEYFLFTIGRNLSESKGEEGDYSDLD